MFPNQFDRTTARRAPADASSTQTHPGTAGAAAAAGRRPPPPRRRARAARARRRAGGRGRGQPLGRAPWLVWWRTDRGSEPSGRGLWLVFELGEGSACQAGVDVGLASGHGGGGVTSTRSSSSPASRAIPPSQRRRGAKQRRSSERRAAAAAAAPQRQQRPQRLDRGGLGRPGQASGPQRRPIRARVGRPQGPGAAGSVDGGRRGRPRRRAESWWNLQAWSLHCPSSSRVCTRMCLPACLPAARTDAPESIDVARVHMLT